MWRVTYLVIPRTSEGGQAGKADKPPPCPYPAIVGYLGEGECSDGKDEEITNSEGRMVKVM
jgi:hypothetical protein